MAGWIACLGAVLLAGPADPDTLVVGPREFLEAFKPWTVHRTNQGHQLGFVSSDNSPEEIREAIRSSAKSGRLRTVVLLGDADPRASRDARVRARTTPTRHVRARVNVQWGSEPEIASDNWYADLDGDEVPDLAVGRITADSADELRTIVRKIIDYENSNDFGAWRQKINLVAGIGGFGALTDTVIEMAAKKFVTEGIPAGYETTVTYGSWQSPYCPDPRFFRETSLRRLNEGCLFWVYIGHGQRTELDQVRVPGTTYPILTARDMPKIKSQAGSPIAVFLACYTGAFDQPNDCLAEELLRAPRGPVAILGGSRVTMPYAMSILGTGLMRECFQEQRETLGEVVLEAKRRLADPADTPERKVLNTVASLLGATPALLAEERREHLHLFNLIGDPLLRLRKPQVVELPSMVDVEAGQRIKVSAKSPISGRCVAELVCRRDRLRFVPPSRGQFDGSDAALAAYTETYDHSNSHAWWSKELQVEPGSFDFEILVPADAEGPCHVRTYVEGDGQHAMGVTDIFVKSISTQASKANSPR